MCISFITQLSVGTHALASSICCWGLPRSEMGAADHATRLHSAPAAYAAPPIAKSRTFSPWRRKWPVEDLPSMRAMGDPASLARCSCSAQFSRLSISSAAMGLLDFVGLPLGQPRGRMD